MSIIHRRLRKLEGEFGARADGEPQQSSALVVRNLAQELVLDSDRCVEILRECGCLSRGPLCLMDLSAIPDGQ